MIVLYIFFPDPSKTRIGPSKPKGAPKKSAGDQLAESVDKLHVEEAPKVKSKNLNVVEEFAKSQMKRMANFVVIGEYISLAFVILGVKITHALN